MHWEKVECLLPQTNRVVVYVIPNSSRMGKRPPPVPDGDANNAVPSTTQSRQGISRRAQLTGFVEWLLGVISQSTRGGTGPSFRAAVSRCWWIEFPPPAPTGQIHDQTMLDGTHC